MKAQSPEKKEKERNNKEKRRGSQLEDMQQGFSAWPEDMQQGSWATPEDMQQQESTSRHYVCLDFQQKGY